MWDVGFGVVVYPRVSKGIQWGAQQDPNDIPRGIMNVESFGVVMRGHVVIDDAQGDPKNVQQHLKNPYIDYAKGCHSHHHMWPCLALKRGQKQYQASSQSIQNIYKNANAVTPKRAHAWGILANDGTSFLGQGPSC